MRIVTSLFLAAIMLAGVAFADQAKLTARIAQEGADGYWIQLDSGSPQTSDIWLVTEADGTPVGEAVTLRVDGNRALIHRRGESTRSFVLGDVVVLKHRAETAAAGSPAQRASVADQVERVNAYQAEQEKQLHAVYPAYLKATEAMVKEIKKLDAATGSGVTYAEYCTRVNDAMAEFQDLHCDATNPVTGVKYHSYGTILEIMNTHQQAKDAWGQAIQDAGSDSYDREMAAFHRIWDRLSGLESDLYNALNSTNPYNL